MADAPPRCGDHVHHRPSAENWVVAYADPERDEIAWAGWPAGMAKLADCDVIKRCSDEEHAEAVRSWADASGPSCWRRDRVLWRHGTAIGLTPTKLRDGAVVIHG
jgi:hypothetical protein